MCDWHDLWASPIRGDWGDPVVWTAFVLGLATASLIAYNRARAAAIKAVREVSNGR